MPDLQPEVNDPPTPGPAVLDAPQPVRRRVPRRRRHKRNPGANAEAANEVRPLDGAACGVCGSTETVTCMVKRHHLDQPGVGYKGLICGQCGTVRIARGRSGNLVFGYYDKWHLQE